MTKFWFNRMDDPIQAVDERPFPEQFADIMGVNELPVVVEDNDGYKGISSQGNCWLYIDEYDEQFLTAEDSDFSDLQIEIITEIEESKEEELVMRKAEAINAMLEAFNSGLYQIIL